MGSPRQKRIELQTLEVHSPGDTENDKDLI